jgi:hypothetical protein
MNDSSIAVSRRSVLVSGLALSVLATPALAASPGEAQMSVLSGRLTDTQGMPLREAQVQMGAVSTRTDGDGRFFMHVVLPAFATVPLQITRRGETQSVEWMAAVERTPYMSHPTASVALTVVT